MPLTTMTDRPDTAWRRCAHVAALACALLLAGCGPGTGGTGTGPISAKYMGTTGPAFSAPASSLCAVSACGDTYLRLEPASVDLRLVCRRFLHEGPWEVDADGLAVLAGTIEVTAGGVTRSAPGTLRLKFTGAPEGAKELSFTLLDAAGNVVAGPASVQREDAALAPVPGSCR